jgi:hypothetical protein
MTSRQHKGIRLPAGRSIRRAVCLYLRYAYSSNPPSELLEFVPPTGFEPEQWLMSRFIERDPPDAPLQGVRSFAMRLGNEKYPHMKLRLSRPPRDETFIFSVDCHDTFLFAPMDSPEYQTLEDLKRHNAIVAEAIRLAWEQARLPTERSYLRRKIQQAKNRSRGGRRKR